MNAERAIPHLLAIKYSIQNGTWLDEQRGQAHMHQGVHFLPLNSRAVWSSWVGHFIRIRSPRSAHSHDSRLPHFFENKTIIGSKLGRLIACLQRSRLIPTPKFSRSSLTIRIRITHSYGLWGMTSLRVWHADLKAKASQFSADAKSNSPLRIHTTINQQFPQCTVAIKGLNGANVRTTQNRWSAKKSPANCSSWVDSCEVVENSESSHFVACHDIYLGCIFRVLFSSHPRIFGPYSWRESGVGMGQSLAHAILAKVVPKGLWVMMHSAVLPLWNPILLCHY